jgi:hypothetical protein
MRGTLAALVMVAVVLGPAVPGRADLTVASPEVLRPIFSRLLGNPRVLDMDVVPDLYEGGYARVSLYARGADIKGMRIDELWIKLVGVSFDPQLLRQGTLKVLSLRDSAIYGKLSLASVEEFLNHESVVRDVRLRLDGESVVGVATVLYNGVPTRVRMQGVFQVYGEPEVYFHIQALLVNWIPVPYVLVDRLERQINPILDLRSWPVAFPIRTFRQTPSGFILSSQRDFSQPCAACGGPLLQLRP